MSNTHFKSPTREEFGMSCSEAIKQHLIEPAYRSTYGKRQFVRDGWESSNSNGVHFLTREEALRHYFKVKTGRLHHHAERIAAGPKPNEVFRYRDGDTITLAFGDGRRVEMGILEMRQRIFELTEDIEIVDA